ncbi:hypothetical protein QQ045_018821 [Rhodiola kirilowii]
MEDQGTPSETAGTNAAVTQAQTLPALPVPMIPPVLVPVPGIPPVIAPLPVIPPVQPIIQAVPPTAIPHPLAPISVAPPRPLAPIPIRPPVLRPPSSSNGQVRMSDSESDQDEMANDGGSAVGYELSESSKQAKERQEKIRQDFLMKRRAAALAVPTNDKAVRDRLRRLGEPITLFGEREMERRDRLRMLMAKLDEEGQLEKLMKAKEEEEAAAEDGDEEMLQYPFYTEGSRELLAARVDIAKYSIKRAALRLQRARRRRDDPDEDVDSEIDWALRQAGNLVLDCSEIGDDRPLSGCSLSNDGNLLGTCSLSGVAKLWSIPQVNKVCTLKGHTERATDVAFSPVYNHLATASADRTAKLWNTEGTLLKSFEGHLDRLARIAFHPSGKYLATTSFDKTWRLWDVNSGMELLLQEGHSRSVYGISFHHDGSLVASSGLDSLARVWDLRTGRSVLAFEGHVKPVLALSFSPNGYHLATGGEDNCCRIWDLRMRKSMYIIPAHSNLISQVKYEPQEGYFLVTSSYDMTAKVWSARDYKPVKTLSGHEDKVTSLDIIGDGHCITTVSYDRTIKVWSARDDDMDKKMDID